MNIENEYRKEIKEKILQLATTMFFQHGIRKVKMDDIANHLKISKRTLYELYQNKEDLLYEVFVLNNQREIKKIEKFDQPGINVINIVIQVFKQHTEELSNINPIFLEEIERYPKLVKYINKRRKEKPTQVIEFIKRGIAEGFFLENTNYEILSKLSDASTRYIMSSYLYNQYSIKEIFKTFVQLYVRGICTEKGIRLLDSEMKKLFD